MTPEEGQKFLKLKEVIVDKFQEENWLELGALTGQLALIKNNHARLLRSLSWGDSDYGGNALSVLTTLVQVDPRNFGTISQYVHDRFDTGGINVSSAEAATKRIYFTPSVFQTPNTDPESDLLSIMMPFSANFDTVHGAVVEAARRNSMRCQRADDIWIHSTVIQDVFSLIYRSHIVVCDFTTKNPNVLYEAGIAHTLGKHMVPITQHPDDIPFDLKSHRYLLYQGNAQGCTELADKLAQRIGTLLPNVQKPYWKP
jgi:hypothetical protein